MINSTKRDKIRESYAGYILNKTTVGNWQFTQGIRLEKIDYKAKIKEGWGKPITGEAKDHNAESYELTVNYLYSDIGSVYLSYVNGYRSPSIQDMGAWYGDIELQENESYELGVKDILRNTYISSSIFFITTDKEIYYDGMSQNKEDKTNKNFDGEVERKGIELSMQHSFDKLVLRENFTYIQPKVTSGKYDGKDFAFVPRWNINLGATYNFTNNLLGNIDMHYQSDAYAQNDFSNSKGRRNSYTTFDANLRYKFNEGLELYAGVRNLFDEEYANIIISGATYYPADGRSYYAGFRYSF